MAGARNEDDTREEAGDEDSETTAYNLLPADYEYPWIRAATS